MARSLWRARVRVWQSRAVPRAAPRDSILGARDLGAFEIEQRLEEAHRRRVDLAAPLEILQQHEPVSVSSQEPRHEIRSCSTTLVRLVPSDSPPPLSLTSAIVVPTRGAHINI